jgi:hypothetical protein
MWLRPAGVYPAINGETFTVTALRRRTIQLSGVGARCAMNSQKRFMPRRLLQRLGRHAYFVAIFRSSVTTSFPLANRAKYLFVPFSCEDSSVSITRTPSNVRR